MKGFSLGLLIGILLVPIGVMAYMRFGRLPVAAVDAPLPFEKEIVQLPLHARIDAESPKSAPIEPSPDNLLAGASIYREQCAACHGLNPASSAFGDTMFPHAPQLWKSHGGGVVGVSDDPPGETFWKVDNGIRLSGMPSYHNILNPVQEWQVSLLLANADKPLSPAVAYLLAQPLYAHPEPPAAPPALAAAPVVGAK